jgi:hypothetical protein
MGNYIIPTRLERCIQAKFGLDLPLSFRTE